MIIITKMLKTNQLRVITVNTNPHLWNDSQMYFVTLTYPVILEMVG